MEKTSVKLCRAAIEFGPVCFMAKRGYAVLLRHIYYCSVKIDYTTITGL